MDEQREAGRRRGARGTLSVRYKSAPPLTSGPACPKMGDTMKTAVCSQGFALGDGRPFSRKGPGKAKGAPTLVLLPGLDGTDVFFRPLLAALPDWIEPVVVQFPTVGANDYQTLLRFVRLMLADRSSYYVLAWSFAGPLALMLAAAEPNNVRGVVLVSTFVRPPRRIFAQLRWAAVPPAVWVIRVCKRLPAWLFRSPDDPLRRDKTETWNRVGAGMIASRIRALLSVDARESLRVCPCPILCLAGSADGIVPRRNVEEIIGVKPSASVCLLEGDHFVIYTNPRATAEAVVDFIKRQEQ